VASIRLERLECLKVARDPKSGITLEEAQAVMDGKPIPKPKRTAKKKA
jgi:hypothetical protein